MRAAEAIISRAISESLTPTMRRLLVAPIMMRPPWALASAVIASAILRAEAFAPSITVLEPGPSFTAVRMASGVGETDRFGDMVRGGGEF